MVTILMKVLMICEFSAGICGVWSRVFLEAKALVSKGHEVHVLSTNIEKGTGDIVRDYEVLDGVKIHRFHSSTSSFSKNVNNFNFSKELSELNPGVVITHLIHPHSFKALKSCQKLSVPCFLVTHAPFGVKRSFPLNLATWLYYNFVVKNKISGFTKIITITNWEVPYLNNLGISGDKLVFIPNSVPEDFFKQKIKPFSNKNVRIMFLGRVAPVKNIPLLVDAFKRINNPDLTLEIVGPIEKGYESIKNFSTKKIVFSKPIFNLSVKIMKLQEAGIFILPSIREGLPQSLLEALALGKIVVASDTLGSKEVIIDSKNGYLFRNGSVDSLVEVLRKVLSLKSSSIKKIQSNAHASVKSYSTNNILNKLNKLLNSLNKK